MYVRPAAATAAVLLGVTALLLPGTASAREQSPAPVVVAHRGASAQAPENTLAAVDRAAELGVDWVENDVQRTKDGVLVVMHDVTLTRTTDVERLYPGRAPWRIEDFTAAEIARLDAGSWFGARFAGQRVPTLEQYLARVSRNGQRLLMELKRPDLYPGIERETLEVLRRQGWLDRDNDRRLIVQSFDEDSLRTVHALRPDVRTAYLGTPAVADLPEFAAFADQINPGHTTISADYVRRAHRIAGPHGVPLMLFTWTVDDARTAVRMRGFGVDGIISDVPDVVRDAIAAGARQGSATGARSR